MLQPGTQIGRYEIQRRLGRGGMGTVYVAHDPVLGRMVAVKVFLSDLDMPDAAERFAREARSAAALNHANIVTVHDFGEWQSQPYIVMEYVQGETLAEIIRRKAPVTTADKLRWIEDLSAGVAYAHQVGVIHRDIKPTNLMIDRSGRLKILDFGIAKMLGTLASSATALIGTPGYMAPEQITGGAIDQRSDLFSIGVVCYELLTYAEAFPGETVPAITHRILNSDPVPVTQLLPEASPDLVAVVERALKKNTADRFADAESFRQAVARVRRQFDTDSGWDPAGATRVSGAPPAGSTIQRGTGSARRPLNDVVSVAELTPPPDPRKTDREARAQRRAAQIEAALELARLYLQQDDLDQALDSCEQALTLDDTHAAALELEQQIKAAMAKKRAGVLVADARGELAKGALTAAQTLLQQARTLDPETPEAKRVERDLRLARVEQERLRQRAEAAQKALASAKAALERGELEAALTFAREVVELAPDSQEARAIEAEALRKLDEDMAGPEVEKTILAPPRRTPAPPPSAAPAPGTKRRAKITAPPAVQAPRKDPFEGVRAVVASALASIAAMPKKQRLVVGGSVAGVLVIAAVAIAVISIPAPPVPTGTLVIDAVPWATITAVQAEDGTNRPLPSPASTPLSLNLPIGTYQIGMAGPGPGGESRTLTVQVQEGAVSATPVERFETLTPEAYFEGYLQSPTPAPDATTPTDAAAAPEAPVAPPVPATPPPPPGTGL
jgi:tetratricopeptide (TPR) repeat protein